MNDKLCLHCGASEVTREAVINVNTPKPSGTWFPIPHISLISRVEEALFNLGMKVTGEAHALTKEGMRYFGILQVASPTHRGSDYSYVVGLRNTNDKSFSACVAVGSRVFVCDNLAFSGEIEIERKHTVHIERDLPLLTSRAVGLLSQRWTTMDDRIAKYKSTEISDLQAHDILVRSLDTGAATACQLPKVLGEWRNPRHPEFAESKNMWRLFNAFTEVAKENPTGMLTRRTINLHGLLDGAVGFKVPELRAVEGTEDSVVRAHLNN